MFALFTSVSPDTALSLFCSSSADSNKHASLRFFLALRETRLARPFGTSLTLKMSVPWLDTSVALSEGVGSCAGRSGDSTTMVSSRSVEDVAVRDGVGRDLEECEGLEA